MSQPGVYEAAWGGMSKDLSIVEHRNPVGRGRRVLRELSTPSMQAERYMDVAVAAVAAVAVAAREASA